MWIPNSWYMGTVVRAIFCMGLGVSQLTTGKGKSNLFSMEYGLHLEVIQVILNDTVSQSLCLFLSPSLHGFVCCIVRSTTWSQNLLMTEHSSWCDDRYLLGIKHGNGQSPINRWVIPTCKGFPASHVWLPASWVESQSQLGFNPTRPVPATLFSSKSKLSALLVTWVWVKILAPWKRRWTMDGLFFASPAVFWIILSTQVWAERALLVLLGQCQKDI
jgi:hypothetical protein